ncbi:hypothetical protein T440DRAFT_470556 [Plenodomus tracheiphilus IPT5]|uniref:Zinc knuckle-domain-containing protein n=1 Tax=Plenodomus tracheiphilus IPT5 TaxID=1408161 RepID=A0A6A7AXE2_9PLEO|nr:hypothetical protein T440DRAFT_470556 [Plenodomus tracheiphilus IPT5]
MFRRPGTGRSKASADTLCQKCLNRGHYSYECKASAQERPYKSRPSRTQQLLNPKLQPKLTTEVPNELLRKKGVADEILRKKEEERRRSRSLSSSSADSVSTISTNRSPSRSRSPPPRKNDAPKSREGDDKARGKRRRRSVSMDSRSSEGDRDRNTRRRMSSFSPGERGRRRSRSRSSRLRPSIENGAARFSRDRSGSARSRSRATRRHEKRPYRRPSLSRSRSRTPDRMDMSEEQPRNGATRGRWGASPPRRSPAPRDSRDRSPSPYSKRLATRRSPGSQRQSNVDRPYNGPVRNRFGNEAAVSNHRAGPPPSQPPPPSVQRERSLSPFSKRVALTRAMQAG